jgi:hypothetical protein
MAVEHNVIFRKMLSPPSRNERPGITAEAFAFPACGHHIFPATTTPPIPYLMISCLAQNLASSIYISSGQNNRTHFSITA